MRNFALQGRQDSRLGYRVTRCAYMILASSAACASNPLASADAEDAIDEAIHFFRAQVMFKEFQPDNAADITLVYNTLFIQQCIQVGAKRIETVAVVIGTHCASLMTLLFMPRLSNGLRIRTKGTNCCSP